MMPGKFRQKQKVLFKQSVALYLLKYVVCIFISICLTLYDNEAVFNRYAVIIRYQNKYTHKFFKKCQVAISEKFEVIYLLIPFWQKELADNF